MAFLDASKCEIPFVFLRCARVRIPLGPLLIPTRVIVTVTGLPGFPRRFGIHDLPTWGDCPTVMLMSEPATTLTFTAVFEPAEEGGYIAFVEELPGANTQGETLEEARENLLEAVTLILEANRDAAEKEIAGRVVIREPLRVRA